MKMSSCPDSNFGATSKQIMQQVAHITASYCAIRPDQVSETQWLCQLCQITLQSPPQINIKAHV